MHPIKKLLVLVIVLLTFFIIYNLLKTRQIMKIKYAGNKEVFELEGFSNETEESEKEGTEIKSIPQKYLSLPIREFIVKSSYNSAINNENIAEKKQIQRVLERGCRLVDFEIYTRNNIEYVSYSNDPQYKSMDTNNDVNNRLSLSESFNTLIGYAFTEPVPSPNDPLFIVLRIKNNSPEAYQRIATLIDFSFKNKLYKGKVRRETPLSDLMGKVIIIMDTTSSPDYKNVKCLSSPCYDISDYVQLEAGTIQFSKYTYTNLETLPQKPVMVKGNKTDVKSFMMITPLRTDQLTMPDPNEVIEKWHPQFLLYKFYKPGKELNAYEEIFNKGQGSLVPISSIVKIERKSNSDQQ